MSKIFNLTQHQATESQLEAGVIEPSSETKALIGKLLTVPMTQSDGLGFAQLSSETQKSELERRAHDLAVIAAEYQASVVRNALKIADSDSLTDFQALCQLEQARGVKVMIGGFQPLMGLLEAALKRRGMTPVVALSDRVVKEVQEGDSVRKVAVFEHRGFYEL